LYISPAFGGGEELQNQKFAPVEGTLFFAEKKLFIYEEQILFDFL
jgi:hypothetical protein